MTTAALGGQFEVGTLDSSQTRVKVPEGTQSGRQFRLKGKGMPATLPHSGRQLFDDDRSIAPATRATIGRLATTDWETVHGHAILDVLALGTLEPLARAFDRPELEVVVHGGDYDVTVLTRDFDFSFHRMASAARAGTNAGLVTICAYPSYTETDRAVVRTHVGDERFIQVFVDTDAALCRERRPDADFAGFEAPASPDLTVHLDRMRVEKAVDAIVDVLRERGQFADV